jgi:hypothetical protein
MNLFQNQTFSLPEQDLIKNIHYLLDHFVTIH